MTALGFCILLLALLASGAPGAVAQGDTILAASDRVKVTVFGQPDISGEFEIDAAGFISMPLIGKVAAANSGAQRLEAAIEAKLLDGYLKNPRISVQVMSLRNIRGAWNRPRASAESDYQRGCFEPHRGLSRHRP